MGLTRGALGSLGVAVALACAGGREAPVAAPDPPAPPVRAPAPEPIAVAPEPPSDPEGPEVMSPKTGPSEPMELAAQALAGPFPSVSAYCARLRRETAAAAAAGEGRRMSCDAREPAASGRVTLGRGERGRLREARVVRVRTEIAGAPVELCRVALRAAGGWYVSPEEDTCEGVVGPSRRTRVVREALAWAGSPGEAVALETEHEDALRSYDVAPDGGRVEGLEVPRRRTLRICGVGPTGAPSCTPAVTTGCTSFEGTLIEGRWTYEGGVLRVTEAGRLAECAVGEPVEAAALRFP